MSTRRVSPWTRVVAGGAVARMLVIVGISLAEHDWWLTPIPWTRQFLLFLNLLAFACAGLLLLAGGARDRRAQMLGIAFILIASAFSDDLLSPDRASAALLDMTGRAVLTVQLDAFVPYFIWQFVREFPRVPTLGRTAQLLRAVTKVSLVTGVALVVANVVLAMTRFASPDAALPRALTLLSRHDVYGVYWAVQFVQLFGALAVLVARARDARADERRRVRLLVFTLGVGTGPTVIWVMLSTLVPAMKYTVPLDVAGWILYPTLLCTPFGTAYVVIVRHALDVSLVVRRAMQYLLARYAVLLVTILPLVIAAREIASRRDLTIGELVGSRHGVLLLTVTAVGVLAIRYRDRVLRHIDRYFFREQYDAGRILRTLVERCRDARDVDELSVIVATDIDRALHLERVTMLTRHAEAGAFVASDVRVRPLAVTSELARRLAECERELDLDGDGDRRRASLPREDLEWLLDSRVTLLLPLRDQESRVLGILALGPKRSELPFSVDDRTLLRSVAAAAELTLAYLHSQRALEFSEAVRLNSTMHERSAVECEECGHVQSEGAECSRCRGRMRECALPQVVSGKFRVERRVGAGAMGVVYRGLDLALGRAVAIKTLPSLALDDARRLLAEARAASATTHPSLATVFGAETWHGHPLLVFEFLPGGTLADKLQQGALPVESVLTFGIALAGALHAIHRNGILHRDIKPSNIGFASDGSAKLLDFGLAYALSATGEHAPPVLPADRERVPPDARGHHEYDSSTGDAVRAGTPAYMSPEALLGAAPDVAFDLWALNVVLYEAVAGCHPLRRTHGTNSGTSLTASIPPLNELAPNAPATLVAYFQSALAPSVRARPRTAAEVGRRLLALRASLEHMKTLTNVA